MRAPILAVLTAISFVPWVGCGAAPSDRPEASPALASDHGEPSLPAGMLRLNRDVLDGRLEASVSDESGSGGRTTVVWDQRPSDEPPPGPGAIADFRDQISCANLGGASFCVRIAGDVSTWELSAKKTWLEAPSGQCPADTGKFLGAEREDDGFTVRFASGCVGQGETRVRIYF